MRQRCSGRSRSLCSCAGCSGMVASPEAGARGSEGVAPRGPAWRSTHATRTGERREDGSLGFGSWCFPGSPDSSSALARPGEHRPGSSWPSSGWKESNTGASVVVPDGEGALLSSGRGVVSVRVGVSVVARSRPCGDRQASGRARVPPPPHEPSRSTGDNQLGVRLGCAGDGVSSDSRGFRGSRRSARSATVRCSLDGAKGAKRVCHFRPSAPTSRNVVLRTREIMREVRLLPLA
jgi:hypothetical protein